MCATGHFLKFLVKSLTFIAALAFFLLCSIGLVVFYRTNLNPLSEDPHNVPEKVIICLTVAVYVLLGCGIYSSLEVIYGLVKSNHKCMVGFGFHLLWTGAVLLAAGIGLTFFPKKISGFLRVEQKMDLSALQIENYGLKIIIASLVESFFLTATIASGFIIRQDNIEANKNKPMSDFWLM